MITLVKTGVCILVALQAGDQTWAAAVPITRTFNITSTAPTQPQTIAFPTIADRTLASGTFSLTATASSGLAITYTSTTLTTCTINGATVSPIAVGTCTITASQPGNSTYDPAPPVTRSFTITASQSQTPPRIDAITNAASNIPGALAPASYAALYGANLTPSPSLTLRDSQGTQKSLDITYSSATQINFLLPDAIAPGTATLTIASSTAPRKPPSTSPTLSPGLFSADSSGRGPAAAQVIIVNADQSTTTRLVTDGPIPVLAGTDIYLVLYGTGLRTHSANGVIAKVVGRPVDVLYAGAQGAFPGLDQVNLRIPLTVGGLGTVEIQLIIDGSTSNTVTATFQ
ncbi:MAG: hypothetical protein WDO18_05270 [Acidobacteriota bacterium]